MEKYIGKKVIVRANMAGVFFGTLTEVSGHDVTLTKARNIYYWEGANNLIDISLKGIKSGCVTAVVEGLVVCDVCELIPLAKNAIKNLEGQPIWQYK